LGGRTRRAGGFGGDFEDVVVGVSEVEEDGVRGARRAGVFEAGEDLGGGEWGVAGVGGEDGDGGIEGVAAGVEGVVIEESLGEPFAEVAGVEGVGVVARESVGDDGPGLSGSGVERCCVLECVVVELFGSGFMHGS
jgi:hypothetical protein